MNAAGPPVAVAILAHNEERRIAACLESLLAEDPAVPIHVAVNGSTDRTAEIATAIAAAHPNVTVHVFAEGGKARSWNRLMFQELGAFAEAQIVVDGDAVVAPGSIGALARALADHPGANAVGGVPMNGRNASAYQRMAEEEHAIFGDLYALRGSFLARMKASGIRLPLDLIGDDSLIGALAKTDLGPESRWEDARVANCPDAGFFSETVSISRPKTLHMQYRRMVNYSVRHYQNQIVSEIMRGPGPAALPERLAELYPAWIPRFAPRKNPILWWFDRLALKRMAGA